MPDLAQRSMRGRRRWPESGGLVVDPLQVAETGFLADHLIRKNGELSANPGHVRTDADYRVEKMRYGKGKGKDKDLTTLHYNDRITVTGIPLEAYDYVVNGKPALDWVVERQGVRTDPASGIVNDANDWAVETMGNPRYPLELFQRVVTVSIETMKIVGALPKLKL
jgi:predicted helicase